MGWGGWAVFSLLSSVSFCSFNPQPHFPLELCWGCRKCPHACVRLSRFGGGRLFVTPWTVAHQAPVSMKFSKQEYWSGLPSSRGSSLPRDWTCVSYVSCIGRQVLYHEGHLGRPYKVDMTNQFSENSQPISVIHQWYWAQYTGRSYFQ